jgi:hypothetical protein
MYSQQNLSSRLLAWAAATVMGGALILAVAVTASAGPPSGENVNVNVAQSDGTPLAGVQINYACGGPTLLYGTTDSGGGVHGRLPDGSTCTFTAIYRGTSAEQQTTVDGTTVVSFQTSAVTVTLSDHSGAPLNGGVASYKSGSTVYLNGTSAASTTGATGTDGAIVGQLFDGTYDFRMVYGPGSEWQYGVTVSGATTVPFQTGLLSIVYSEPLSYGQPNANSAWFTKPGTELLPGDYNFHPRGVGSPPNSGCQPIPIAAPAAGTSATKTILAAQLIDSSDNPLAGGTFDYYAGGWHNSAGTTDSTGAGCAVVDGALGSNVYVRMHYNGTSQMVGPQNVATDSVFDFQTTDVTVRLENHLGDLIDTGSASYYAVSWHTIGNTSGGQVHVQMLPGSYSFAMVYGGIRQQLNSVAIGAIPTAVTFQTALVSIHFSGTTQYIVIPGVWTSYTGAFEMLPVTETFGFSGTGYSREQLQFTPSAGTVFERTILYASVKASDGSGISGVPAVWWNYGGPTSASSTTNGNGHVLFAANGAPTNTNVRITYSGANSSLMFQNPQTNSFYDFQLVKVTVQLEDNTGAVIGGATPAVTYHYYGAGEATFGTMSGGSVNLDLLPASNSYFFTIADYNGGHDTISKTISGTTTVVFQTGKVVDGGFGATSYHQYGVTPDSSFTDPMQLLPGNYFFYNGTTTLNKSVIAGETLNLATGAYTTP